MIHEVRVSLTADQVAQIVSYDQESKRAVSLRDAMIRGIALGSCSAKDLDRCRIQVTDEALICIIPEPPTDGKTT